MIDFERAMWAEPLMEVQFRGLSWGGVNESMVGYGKTTFTADEERRSRLYTLHLALVMSTECSYRDYDTDFVAKLARHLLGASMEWLEAH